VVLHSLPARPLCLCLRSVAIRRWLAQRPEAAAQLFGAQRLPSLLQYDPYSRLLERHPEDGAPQGGEEGASLPACLHAAAHQPVCLTRSSSHCCPRLPGPSAPYLAGTLVVSAIGTPNTAAPLLRYCIGDAGGTISYAGGGGVGIAV
jgi:phenylacetate-CoA ligase